MKSEAVNTNLLKSKRLWQKLIKHVKLRNTCEIDGIPNECLRHIPRGACSLSALVTSHFNMSTVTVFLDNEKVCDTTWHPGLLRK
jgi:hypothetical protein